MGLFSGLHLTVCRRIQVTLLAHMLATILLSVLSVGASVQVTEVASNRKSTVTISHGASLIRSERSEPALHRTKADSSHGCSGDSECIGTSKTKAKCKKKCKKGWAPGDDCKDDCTSNGGVCCTKKVETELCCAKVKNGKTKCKVQCKAPK